MTTTLGSRTRAITAVAAAISMLGAACTSSPGPEPSTPSPDGSSTGGSSSGPAPSPSGAPAFDLVVDLQDVSADGVGERIRPRELREPAQAVLRTITELYSVAFVDPASWPGGFPAMFPLFAGAAREEARGDVQRLTLGRTSQGLEAVRPRRAVLDVRFLADAAERPVVAVADMRFEGVGLEDGSADGATLPIRHEGEYTLRRVNGRWRIVAYDVISRSVQAPGEAAFAPGLPSLRPMFVLVIGSDARPGQSVTSARADSLHIVGVNPRRGRASVLGIPRDSWVAIPGAGSDKINAALVRGGPELLVDTVEHLSGIDIDAYVLTGFDGFERLVGEIGGIDITIPFPIHDAYAHASFGRGPEHLSGNEALAFSRARHALPNGDFGRSLNQGRVLIAALATLREQLRQHGRVALIPWAIAGARYLRTDLSLGDLFELLIAAPAFEPRRIRNEVVTGHTGAVGGRSVVFLDGGAYAQFRDLADDGVLGA